MEKYPELRKLFEKLMAEKADIRELTAELWAEYSELRADMGVIQVKAKRVSDEIKAIERPRVGEIDMELSAIARAMGGYRLSDT